MLVTMTLLCNWVAWDTGVVKAVSAGGLHTWSNKAYSSKTFQVAMKNLETMGWITRHMTHGSMKDYSITIHNYKWMGRCADKSCCNAETIAGKVHILNPKTLRSWRDSAGDHCGEGSYDGSDEASYETSGKDQSLSTLKSDLKSSLNSEGLSSSHPIYKKPSVSSDNKQKEKTVRFSEQEQKQVEKAMEDIYGNDIDQLHYDLMASLPDLLGAPINYDTDYHLINIILLHANNWFSSIAEDDRVTCQSVTSWVVGLTRWALCDRFWKKHVTSLARLAKHMANERENNICQQYNQAVNVKKMKA
jgi:hypothetical protein